MQLFTFCAGIVGMAAVGCLTASWIGISSPLAFNISGNEIVILSSDKEILRIPASIDKVRILLKDKIAHFVDAVE